MKCLWNNDILPINFCVHPTSFLLGLLIVSFYSFLDLDLRIFKLSYIFVKHIYHLVLHIVAEVDELVLPVPVLVLVLEDGPEDPRIVRRKTDAVTARGPVGLLRLKYQTST